MPAPLGLTWQVLQLRLHLRSASSGSSHPVGSTWQVSQARAELMANWGMACAGVAVSRAASDAASRAKDAIQGSVTGFMVSHPSGWPAAIQASKVRMVASGSMGPPWGMTGKPSRARRRSMSRLSAGSPPPVRSPLKPPRSKPA